MPRLALLLTLTLALALAAGCGRVHDFSGDGSVNVCGASDTCTAPCDDAHKLCVDACVPTSHCCRTADCSETPGTMCDQESGSCVPLTGCTGSPLLGCPCDALGTLACNGVRQALKLQCVGGLWVDNTTCAIGENCNQSDGRCHAIVSACVSDGPIFCSDSNTQQTCNADYTSTAPMTCVGVCSSTTGTCQPPVCGDGRLEADIGEECDDGNNVKSDGCEPDCKRSRVVALTAGIGHTCALLSSGEVRCWGDNALNQLGLPNTTFVGTTPPYMIDTVNFGDAAVGIAAGTNHTCAMLAGGGVRCWGDNSFGQLGQGDTVVRLGPAPAITFVSPVKSISAGGALTCVLLQNGDVHCWGANVEGALGLATTASLSSTTPADALGPVSIGSAVRTLASGSVEVCVILQSGAVLCWGSGGNGELGRGDTINIGDDETPAMAPPLETPTIAAGHTASGIGCGPAFACAQFENGGLECWGSNSAGQLGLGQPASGTTLNIGDDEAPATNGITLLPGVAAIFTGNSSVTCVGEINGGARCWGLNTKGQLGYGDTTNRGADQATRATQLPDLSVGAGVSIITMAIGAAHTCALLSNSELKCWGRNNVGQLGNGVIPISGPDFIAQVPSALPPVQVFPP